MPYVIVDIAGRFENRQTAWFRVQGVLRIGRLAEPDLVERELQLFNRLLPGRNRLQAALLIEVADEMGWSRRRFIPHGGHQLALNIAAGLELGGSESYPGVFEPYGGFADAIPIVGGYVRPHADPGIGVELRAVMFAEMRKRLDFA